MIGCSRDIYALVLLCCVGYIVLKQFSLLMSERPKFVAYPAPFNQDLTFWREDLGARAFLARAFRIPVRQSFLDGWAQCILNFKFAGTCLLGSTSQEMGDGNKRSVACLDIMVRNVSWANATALVPPAVVLAPSQRRCTNRNVTRHAPFGTPLL
jgi:hypothetical protein